MKITTFPGNSYPLGATWDGKGVNFTLYTENATGVQLCLFNKHDDKEEFALIEITEYSELIWHVYIPGLKPGQL